ncbi:MAG TPA: hypothetical protein VF888_04995, partial [Nitrospirota bacterium]
NAPIRLKLFPEATLLARMSQRFGLSTREAETESSLVRMLEDVQPALKTLESLGFSGHSEVLRVPDLD